MKEIRDIYERCLQASGEVILGLEPPLKLALAALLTGGHCLLEGLPGTGKTLMVRVLASLFGGEFRRVQFTPDLMPTDIIGNMVFHMKEGEFRFRKGPLFSQFLLADEINRAPAKTQSALLEAMQERKVTVDGTDHFLGPPFVVFATQNPIEQEGTYPLPEAQLDRFMFKLFVAYPEAEAEIAMLKKHQRSVVGLDGESVLPKAIHGPEKIVELQRRIGEMTVRDELYDYLNRLIRETRNDPALTYGASPRASLMTLLGAKGLAAFEGRDYALPDDIKAAFLPALRHRVILAPMVEVEDRTPDDILTAILNRTEVPK